MQFCLVDKVGIKVEGRVGVTDGLAFFIDKKVHSVGELYNMVYEMERGNEWC